jgi:nitrate reductase gamma subunit
VRHIHPLARVTHIGPPFFVGYWIFVALLGFIYFWPSRVSFVHSSSPSSAARRKAFVAIMLLVTVAVVAGAIRLLFRRLFKQ